MTLLAGLVATIAGSFPNLSGRLLGFVGTYGTVLGPMGACDLRGPLLLATQERGRTRRA